MHDDVDVAGNPHVVGDIGVDEREPFVAEVVLDVAGLAGDEVVDRDDLVSSSQQRIAEM